MDLPEKKRGQRQQNLVESALQVFAKHGIDGASVADIADAADVAKGSIYLYFDSKDSLAGEVMRHIFSYEVTPDSPLMCEDKEPLKRIIGFVQTQQDRILALGDDAPIVLHMFGHIGKTEQDQIGRGISQFMRESIYGCRILLENAIRRSLLPSSCDAKSVAEQIVAATYGAIHQRISVSSTNVSAVDVTINVLKGQGADLK